jgi:hypothetical protein
MQGSGIPAPDADRDRLPDLKPSAPASQPPVTDNRAGIRDPAEPALPALKSPRYRLGSWRGVFAGTRDFQSCARISYESRNPDQMHEKRVHGA